MTLISKSWWSLYYTTSKLYQLERPNNIITMSGVTAWLWAHLVHKRRPFELINALKRLYTGPVIASPFQCHCPDLWDLKISFFSLGSCSLSSVMSEVFSGAPFLSFNIGRTSWAPTSDVTLGTKFWWGSWDPPPK